MASLPRKTPKPGQQPPPGVLPIPGPTAHARARDIPHSRPASEWFRPKPLPLPKAHINMQPRPLPLNKGVALRKKPL